MRHSLFRVAQWERVGLITQRAMDRNHSLKHSFFALVYLTFPETTRIESQSCQLRSKNARFVSSSFKAAPHIEEAADQAGEAVQSAAHTIAENAEPTVERATEVAQKKV